MLTHNQNGSDGRLAMIDSGSTVGWRPSTVIRNGLGRSTLEFITNADQDHMDDLQGLWDQNITVTTLFRNPTYTGEDMRRIKRQSGPLSIDAQGYASACESYNQPVTEPFNAYMGGITATTFWNDYPAFQKTNDLSLVVFIQYAGVKILFSGDLEKPG